MKAIVNIGLRTVRISYPVKKIIVPHAEWNQFDDYELTLKDCKPKTPTICNHTIKFDDADEWKSVTLFDGRVIDFHYDYEERSEFNNKKDWGNYIFQGYLYTEGEEQQYNDSVVTKVLVKF